MRLSLTKFRVPEKFSTDQSMHIIGTNIGGASSKVAVMDERGEFCELFLLPSGFSAVKVARQIKQALEQKGYADGVIDVVLSGCHTYATLTNRIKEASREAGANYMSLKTDYSKQGVGQIRTRSEALIELL